MNLEKAALELIQHTYDATMAPEKWQIMLEKFVGFMNVNSAVLREVNYDSGAVGLFNTVGYDPTLKQAYREHFVHLDIFAPVLQQSSAGAVISGDQAVPWSVQMKTEFYNDYVRPQGARYILGATLAKDSQHHLLFGLQRSKKQGEFTADDTKLIQLISPHIARAAQIHRQLCNVTTQKQWAFSALDCLKTGVILFNDKGHPLFINRSIEQLMFNKWLIVDDDGIIFHSNKDTLHVQRLIAEAILCAHKRSTIPGGKFTVQDGKSSLQIQVIPLPQDLSEQGFCFSNACVAAFISTPSNTQPEYQKLATQYGLTSAEIKLTLKLLEGWNLETAAIQLSISKQTARSQLKAIFAKTNVKRQTDLILLLLTDLSLAVTLI